MSHLAFFPPPCGAFCTGCKICCDIVVDEIDSPVGSRYSLDYIERAQKLDDINTRLNTNAIQRRNGTTRDSTTGEISTEVAGKKTTTRGNIKLLDRSRISHDCYDRHRICVTCPKRQSEEDRREDDEHPRTCVHFRCSRNCAARRVKYKGGKLRCIALCCIGRLTCYGKLFRPRGRECCCALRQLRTTRQTWCCCSSV